jgi:CBS domain-containing protein
MPEVKDIMTRHVISVKKETPIYQAIALLARNNISGIPVVEDDMTLVGVLSEKDMLKLFHLPKEVEDKTVGDFMTQQPISFDENYNLQAVCNCLANSYFRRVPVTSEGKLIGIVSRRDIIRYMFRARWKKAYIS